MTESSNSTMTQQIHVELETNILEVTNAVKWRLTNFFSYVGDVNLFIDSKTFTTYFDGKKEDWYLKIFPFGKCNTVEREGSITFPFGSPAIINTVEREDSRGWLNLYLINSTSSFTASIRFAILDQTNTEQFIQTKTVANKNAINFDKFAERCKLFHEKNKFLVNGTLTILCTITKSKVKNLKGVLARDSRERAVQLSIDLEDLLKTSKLSDLTLIAGGGKEFHAHRNILAARSPVFSAMFEHEFKEHTSGRVNIPDIESKTMEYLLNFIYTGECRGDIKDVAEDLLQASNKYQLNDLKDICSNELLSRINNDNSASLLALAELCNATDLKASVLDFVVSNFKAVTISEEWNNLSATNPRLVAEVNDRVIEKLH